MTVLQINRPAHLLRVVQPRHVQTNKHSGDDEACAPAEITQNPAMWHLPTGLQDFVLWSVNNQKPILLLLLLLLLHVPRLTREKVPTLSSVCTNGLYGTALK